MRFRTLGAPVVGKLQGKSDRQAALEAGYAPSTADNTKQKIMSRPEVQAAFLGLLGECIPVEKLVQCIVDGLDAVQTKCFHRKGRITQTITLPDYRARLLFIVLALKLKGLDVPPTEEKKPTTLRVRWERDEDDDSPALEW